MALQAKTLPQNSSRKVQGRGPGVDRDLPAEIELRPRKRLPVKDKEHPALAAAHVELHGCDNLPLHRHLAPRAVHRDLPGGNSLPREHGPVRQAVRERRAFYQAAAVCKLVVPAGNPAVLQAKQVGAHKPQADAVRLQNPGCAVLRPPCPLLCALTRLSR